MYFSQAPIAAIRRDRYPREESIHYFTYSWWELDNFAPLPQLSDNFSMVVADGRLYIAGRKKFGGSGVFYRYDVDENEWISLQPMVQIRDRLRMLYLDGFIYAISDYACRSTRAMERYDVSKNRWEKVQGPPLDPRVPSVVTFKGRILASVYVFEAKPKTRRYYDLLIYHPSKNMWQRTDVTKNFDIENERNNNCFQSVLLFIHKEECYRVVMHRDFVSTQTVTVSVTVNIVGVEVCDDGEVICTIKDEIKQDPKPAEQNAFRIHNEVFVFDYGTGFACSANLCTEEHKLISNIVTFTFDKQKLLDRNDPEPDF